MCVEYHCSRGELIGRRFAADFAVQVRARDRGDEEIEIGDRSVNRDEMSDSGDTGADYPRYLTSDVFEGITGEQ